MILTGDYHTHTIYSHGKGTIAENAIAAQKIGLEEIGITDHGFNHPVYGMKPRELKCMREECTLAQAETNVKVRLGCEANLIGIDGKTDVKEKYLYDLDLLLCGAHIFVFLSKFSDYFRYFGANFLTNTFKKDKPSEQLIKNTTKAYINLIKNNPVDVITHLNFRYFSNPIEVAKCARDYGTYIEINTKKTHLSDDEWNKVAETGVRFVIGSDAHSPNRVGEISLAKQLLNRVSIDLRQIDNIDGRLPDFRFAKVKKERK